MDDCFWLDPRQIGFDGLTVGQVNGFIVEMAAFQSLRRVLAPDPKDLIASSHSGLRDSKAKEAPSACDQQFFARLLGVFHTP
jgi:hypothetical protein